MCFGAKLSKLKTNLYPIFYTNSLLMKDTICLLQWDHFYACNKEALTPYPIHGVGDTALIGRLGTWSHQQSHILGLCEKGCRLYRTNKG
jgi:hypothetical protein